MNERDTHREARGPHLRWRAIVDALPDPALLCSPSGAILHHNMHAAELYPRLRPGLRTDAVIRQPALARTIETVARGGPAVTVELRDRVPVVRALRAVCSPVAGAAHGAGNHAAAVLVVIRDMTEYERHARMRSDFVANASHELRTPLASFKAIVETLQGAARDDSAARDRFLAMMLEQSDRMTRLIDDLLSLSRAEMKEHLPPRDSVNVTSVLRSVVEQLAPLAARENVTLKPALDDAPAILVRGEREELAQMFQNLVHNAIKYGGRPGEVDVTLATEGHAAPLWVRIDVRDNGIGIKSEHIPRLTERFYRVDVDASRERGGTGLGLAIVKYILNRHRGQLEIRSRENEGAVFTVRLPVQACAAIMAEN